MTNPMRRSPMSWPLYGGISGEISVIQHRLVIQTI
jgi:hypothetical protein